MGKDNFNSSIFHRNFYLILGEIFERSEKIDPCFKDQISLLANLENLKKQYSKASDLGIEIEDKALRGYFWAENYFSRVRDFKEDLELSKRQNLSF